MAEDAEERRLRLKVANYETQRIRAENYRMRIIRQITRVKYLPVPVRLTEKLDHARADVTRCETNLLEARADLESYINTRDFNYEPENS